jgi:hypothetical protein
MRIAVDLGPVHEDHEVVLVGRIRSVGLDRVGDAVAERALIDSIQTQRRGRRRVVDRLGGLGRGRAADSVSHDRAGAREVVVLTPEDVVGGEEPLGVDVVRRVAALSVDVHPFGQ